MSEEATDTQAKLEAYNSYWDAISTEKTLLSGRYQEGMAKIVLFQLEEKFGAVAEHYRHKILEASPELVQTWAIRVLKCLTIEKVFEE